MKEDTTLISWTKTLLKLKHIYDEKKDAGENADIELELLLGHIKIAEIIFKYVQ